MIAPHRCRLFPPLIKMGMAKRPRGWRSPSVTSSLPRGHTQAIVARPSAEKCFGGRPDCLSVWQGRLCTADEMNQLVYLFSLTFLSNEQANRQANGVARPSEEGGRSIALRTAPHCWQSNPTSEGASTSNLCSAPLRSARGNGE